jgi:hypothetical protein
MPQTFSALIIAVIVAGLFLTGYESDQQVSSFIRNRTADDWMAFLTLIIVAIGITSLFMSHAAHQRELRAYIHLSDQSVKGLETLNTLTKFIPENWNGDIAIKPPLRFGSNKISYRITFKNFGKTPAHYVMAEAKTFVATFPLALNHRAQFPSLMTRKDLETKSKGLQDVLIDGSLGPDGQSALEISLKPLNDDEILLLTLGENSAIYFYGRIQYRDAFNVERETNFVLCHHKNNRNSSYVNDFTAWINGNKAT